MKVRLKATMVRFYYGDPKDYGVETPEEMAQIDMEADDPFSILDHTDSLFLVELVPMDGLYEPTITREQLREIYPDPSLAKSDETIVWTDLSSRD